MINPAFMPLAAFAVTTPTYKQEVVSINDFYFGAGDLRQKALRGGFKDVEFGGQTYHGISLMPPPGSLWTSLKDAVGQDLVPAFNHFCLSGEDHKLESGAYIHADSVLAPHVAILYLTSPSSISLGSGTALWRHKSTGWRNMPDAAELGRFPGGAAAFLEDWKNPEAWYQDSVIEQKFNRLAIYPAARFHSRWPFQSSGTNPFNSRLIWTCWFDKK